MCTVGDFCLQWVFVVAGQTVVSESVGAMAEDAFCQHTL